MARTRCGDGSRRAVGHAGRKRRAPGLFADRLSRAAGGTQWQRASGQLVEGGGCSGARARAGGSDRGRRLDSPRGSESGRRQAGLQGEVQRRRVRPRLRGERVEGRRRGGVRARGRERSWIGAALDTTAADLSRATRRSDGG